jgi:hypothetical protein
MKDDWQAPLTALIVVILFATFNAKLMQNTDSLELERRESYLVGMGGSHPSV